MGGQWKEWSLTFAAAVKEARERFDIMIASAPAYEPGTGCTFAAVMLEAAFHKRGISTARATGGYAVWRVGPGAGDVVGHHPNCSTILEGEWCGHAWVQIGHHIIDITTTDLQAKLRSLDAADGRRSSCVWFEDVLITTRKHENFRADVRKVINGFDRLHHYEERSDAAFWIEDARATISQAEAA